MLIVNEGFIMTADLVLIGENVLTMNSAQPNAEAVAIKNNKIVYVGTNDEVNSWIGKKTKIINFEGGTVVPGLIDTHIHVADFGKFLTWVALKDAQSIKEMQRRIRKRAMKISEGRWIIGHGWDQKNFTEQRYPNLRDLNKASPHNPVILYHQCGRVCAVNSRALELAGITEETRSPIGGMIEKDAETGKPTGILRENATDLVWKIIPEPSEEEIMEAATLACEKIVEAGVTSVHWIVTSLTEIPVIQRLSKEKNLPLRIYPVAPVEFLDKTNGESSLPRMGRNTARIWGVNIFVDGFLATRTAALREPYSDDNATKGQLLYSQDELNKLVAKACKANFALVIHAMGDQAIRMALTAIEKASKEAPRKNHRYRIDQASVLNKMLIQRIKKLGVTVSIQPNVVISEFSVWSAVERLGPKRVRWLYPLKTLIDEGIVVIGGSDCPMEPLSPLLGIHAAMVRQFFPEERITVDDALRMYTVNAAYASFEEDLKGSIDEGKLADLTVLSDDPRTTPTSKIGDIKVRMTIVGGKVAYREG
jgi:predicted amidohydrolase YtcJ